MIGYAILLVVALLLNSRDCKMLALSLVAGAGIFAPIPDAHFYLWCIVVEIGVALAALLIAVPATGMIIKIAAMLVVMHILGWLFDGYPPASPYHAGVKTLEHAQLVICCLLSGPILKRLQYVRSR